MGGLSFKVDKAEISGDILTLQEGQEFIPDKEVKLFLFSKNKNPEQKTISFGADDDAFEAPHVHVNYPVNDTKSGKGRRTESKSYMGSDGYGVKLNFGKAVNGKIPCYIILRLPDKNKSFVEGYFEAQVK